MRSTRAPWPILLALALLAVQAYGHWHRVAHAQPPAVAAASERDHDHGHHAGDAECRLLDQLSQADGLAWALPVLATAGAAPRPAVEALRSARLAPSWRHRARGPPLG